MLDVVTTKVEFEVPTEERAKEIYDTIRVDNEFVFNTIGSTPSHIYHYAVRQCCAMSEEEFKNKPFIEMYHERIARVWFGEYKKCKISELEWHGGNIASFKLYTLCDVPPEVLLGFGIKFKVPFTLKHVGKYSRTGGIEKFELDENERFRITWMSIHTDEDIRDLYIELMGYAPKRDIELKGYAPRRGIDLLRYAIEEFDFPPFDPAR